MLRARRLDLVIAVVAVALLAVSVAPWARDVHGTETTVWHAPAAVGASIAVALLSAALWLARRGRGWRFAATAGGIGSAAWFLCYTQLGVPAAFVTSESGWTFYAGAQPPKLTAAGTTAALPIGSVLVTALAALMVCGLVVDLARHRSTPDERRRAAVVVPIVGIIAVLAVGFTPWWWSRGATIVTADAWSVSTVWSAALGLTTIALGVWLCTGEPTGRLLATGLAVVAAVGAVAYTATRPSGNSDAAPRRYVDYLPPVPFHRDELVRHDGTSGFDVGTYLGIGLITLVAVAMLGGVLSRRLSARTGQLAEAPR